jgi:hypothetical protein
MQKCTHLPSHLSILECTRLNSSNILYLTLVRALWPSIELRQLSGQLLLEEDILAHSAQRTLSTAGAIYRIGPSNTRTEFQLLAELIRFILPSVFATCLERLDVFSGSKLAEGRFTHCAA